MAEEKGPTASATPAAPPAQQLAVGAQNALRNGDFGAARDFAGRLERMEPQNPLPYKIAATALANQEKRESALKEVEAGLKMIPGDKDLLDLKKMLTKKLSEEDIPSMRASLSLLEGKDHLAGARGDRKGTSDRSDVRLAATFPMLSIPPSRQREPGRLEKGIGSLKLGDLEAAERELTRHLKDHPADWRAFHSRAMARYRRKDLPAAVSDATAALKLNADDAWAFKIRALTFMDLARYAEAEADIERALRINAYDADAYRTRAMIREKQGRFADMVADLKHAAELDPVFEKLYREALEQHPGAAGSAARGVPGKKRGLALLGLLAALVPLSLFLKESGDSRVFSPAGPRASVSPILSAEFKTGRSDPSVGGYNIVRKLGQGGMGVVFEAFDQALQRTVALKRMRGEISGNRREAARFLKEAKTVAALNHPNIVRIYSIIERADGLFLVFEYVPGETLDQLLGRKGALAPKEALDILRPVAKALDYAHGRGIVHRDLKPSNVMIVEDGTPKVMDFGIARQVQESLSRLSREEPAGTPAYMAPEQELGKSHKESDLYALAVCFYEMLTGQTPFSGAHPIEQKLRGIYTPLSQASPGLPAKLDGVLAKALDPARDKRYASAGALLAAIEGALA